MRRLVGSAFGLGRLPVAPGTWGSLLPIALAALVFGLDGAAVPFGALAHDPWIEGLIGPSARWLEAAKAGAASLADPAGLATPRALLWLGAALLLLVLGVVLGDRAEQDWGRPDPGAFVLDEVVGQMLALTPLLAGPLPPVHTALAFAAFRFFDVVKPPPCRALERLGRGLGIMADDVAAGIYAFAVVALTVRWT